MGQARKRSRYACNGESAALTASLSHRDRDIAKNIRFQLDLDKTMFQDVADADSVSYTHLRAHETS